MFFYLVIDNKIKGIFYCICETTIYNIYKGKHTRMLYLHDVHGSIIWVIWLEKRKGGKNKKRLYKWKIWKYQIKDQR